MTGFADPEVTIKTRDVKTLLDATGVTLGLGGITAATLRFQQRADGSSYQSGSNHMTYTATAGYLKPSRLSADQDSRDGAELEAMFFPLWDGSTKPLVVNVSQSLSVSPAFNQLYYLGPAYLNGSEIGGVVGVDVDFGIDYRVVRENGEAYARKGVVAGASPKISIRLLKAAYAATTALFGYALPGTLAVYFQKGVHGSDRVAAATAGHIKITAASGDMTPSQIRVANEDDATVTLEVLPTAALGYSTTIALGS